MAEWAAAGSIIYKNDLMEKNMIVPEDDRRRMGQEKYLKGAKIRYVPLYEPFSEQWEHEHCCFCTLRISRNKSDAHSGYCSTDEKQTFWICEACFEDFKDEFQWILIE